MVELRIDGMPCPLSDERIYLPGFSAKRLRSIETWRNGESVRVEVVATPDVRVLLHYNDLLHRPKHFNDSYHHAELIADGVVVFDGVAIFIGAKHREGVELLLFTIRRGGAEWANSAALTRLSGADIAYTQRMTLQDIENSWYGDSVVRMLPLCYDSYDEPEATGLYVAQKTRLPQDYHPFIAVRSIFESVARKSGYRIDSNFLNSSLASQLMISGNYRSMDGDHALATMGFKAVRSKSSTLAAGSDGRVYLSEPIFATNIGALVDTVNSATLDEDGHAVSDAYAMNNCFVFDAGRPCFKPLREVRVAFDIHLRYRTQFRVSSSRRLTGFDRIYVGNDCEVHVELQNPYEDQRDSVVSGIAYTLMIFDYSPDCVYRLEGYGDISAANSTLVFESNSVSKAHLYYHHKDDAEFREYMGDWALYNGYVSGAGVRDVEITIRTPFEHLGAKSSKSFNDLYIGGAEPGQELTLKRGCSIEPIFSGAPGYGEEAEYRDMANIDVSEADVMEAVAHMFNLRFYPHPASQCVVIEPYDDFYSGAEVDWRSRQVGDVELVECSPESFEHTTYRYIDGDGAVRAMVSSDDELGVWHSHHESYAAKHSVDSHVNPLFMPTASFTGVSGGAPSAVVLTVGNRNAVTKEAQLEPRIVLYHGVKTLPKGEIWDSPNGDNGYPLATFHGASFGETLCFEDRDGCQGLHRYYDSELAECRTRQLLTCSIYLTPEEYISFFDPMGYGASLRSYFRLDVEGSSALFRLEEMGDYDVEKRIAKCTFQQILKD